MVQGNQTSAEPDRIDQLDAAVRGHAELLFTNLAHLDDRDRRQDAIEAAPENLSRLSEQREFTIEAEARNAGEGR